MRLLVISLSFDFFFLQEFREPKLDSQIVTKFLPALMSLMVDDQVRMLNSKLPPDERESAITIIEHSGKTTYSYCIYCFLCLEKAFKGINYLV